MNRLNKYYNEFVYYSLNRRLLSEDEFFVITTLNENEKKLWLSCGRNKILNVMDKFNVLVKYQHARLCSQTNEWVSYRNKISTRDRLFADAARFKIIPLGYSDKEQAINLLASLNKRQAIIWSLRLKIKIPKEPIVLEHPECIGFILENDLLIKSN